MRYEWDKAKNRANIAKHGIDFADAVAVFEDTLALTLPDPGSHGEPRFVTVGIDAFNRHLVVVFTETRDNHPNNFSTSGYKAGAQIP
jgi:uncharacterized DUF497 family protein